jgi:hypothetical protein
MSFRIFQPGTQFFTNDGQVLAGGSISFYDSGTTTPKDTYSDPTLTTPNANPVEINAAGRPVTDIWGDGSYRVVIKSADGVTLVTLDNVSGPQGIPDPSLQSGKFLTNDGTDIFWEDISQVPDPTGADNGDVLTTDGAGNLSWQPLPPPPPEPDVPTVEIGQTSLILGAITGGKRFCIQTGTATAPASGTHTSNVAVAFPDVFDTLLFVSASVMSFPVGTVGFGATVSLTSASESGFTIQLDTNEAQGGGPNINNPVPLRWFAVGLLPEESS